MRTMTGSAIRATKLPSGEPIPVLGQGSWHMAEDPERREEEIASLRLGIELGMTLIDTAEMYGGGGAEQLVGEAIEGRRDDVFLVSKLLPHHATRRGTVEACEASLRRLRTDRLDLYLLHWRGEVALRATVDGFNALRHADKIRYWGVSNFDVSDLEELVAVPGGSDVATDEVLYNLLHRGVEWDLLPWCRSRKMPVLAYSPIEQGRMLIEPELARVAARHRATPAQVAIAWIIRQDRVVAIPKASSPEHVRANRAAADIRLTEEDLAVLDRAFPPPRGPVPLEML
jgi:diketogulonate reductase-like aldo/keto reductase